VLRAIDDEKKDVKRSQGMKLSALFIETLDRVQKMLEENLPIRDGTWSTPEVEMIRAKYASAGGRVRERDRDRDRDRDHERTARERVSERARARE
jgi:hypothetical protein